MNTGRADLPMLGRVAEAIFASNEPNAEWGHLTPKMRLWYLALARAAIEEMREPTAEMISAALPQNMTGGEVVIGDYSQPRRAFDNLNRRQDLAIKWRSMIAQALVG